MPSPRISEEYWEWLTQLELARARADKILTHREGEVAIPGVIDLHHARDAIAELVLEGWCQRAAAGWSHWRNDLCRIFADSGMRDHVDDLMNELQWADISPRTGGSSHMDDLGID